VLAASRSSSSGGRRSAASTAAAKAGKATDRRFGFLKDAGRQRVSKLRLDPGAPEHGHQETEPPQIAALLKSRASARSGAWRRMRDAVTVAPEPEPELRLILNWTEELAEQEGGGG
jgi:hypothetical protein